MRSYSDITSRYLKVQRKRTVLTIIGITLSVALITGIGTILVSFRDKMIRGAVEYFGDYHVLYSNVPEEKVNKLGNHVQVKSYGITSEIGDAFIAPVSKEEKEKNPDAPPNRYLKIKSYDQKALSMLPVNLKEGRLPKSPDEIVLDFWVLKYLPGHPGIGDTVKLKLGQRIQGKGENYTPESGQGRSEVFLVSSNREYKIVGLTQPRRFASTNYLGQGITYLGRESLSPESRYSVYIKMKTLSRIHENAREILSDVGLSEASIEFNEQLLRLYAQSLRESLNDSMKAILLLIVGLVVVSTIAVIYNTFHISVMERISQFGLLRCVGASPSQIRKIVLKEALILSAVGIPLGIACGLLAMKAVYHVVDLIVVNFVLSDLRVIISPAVIITSVVLGLVTVCFSAYGPARKAGRVPAVDAVRSVRSYQKENIKSIPKSWLTGLIFGFEGKLAWKNLRRNRKRFSVTVFSMVISIVLYITFANFVTFAYKSGGVKVNEMGDFYIFRSSGFSENDYREFKDLPGVKTVFKHLSSRVDVLVPESILNKRFKELIKYELEQHSNGRVLLENSTLISYGNESLAELKKFLREGKIDIEAMNKKNGVLVVNTGKLFNEKAKRNALVNILDLKVGDSISISTQTPSPKTEKGARKNAKVLGILSKGIFNEEYNEYGGIYIITTEQVYERFTGNTHYKEVYIKLHDTADKQHVSNFLKKYRENNPDVRYFDYVESSRKERREILVISIFLFGFMAVIALIGSLNIINTVSTNLILRTREFSTLRAVGMTGTGIKKLVFLESIYYGIIASFYGSIIGTILTYVVFNIMYNVREFTWSIPWNHIITAALGAQIIALFSGYLPLKRISRKAIVEGIRMVD